MNLAGLYRKAHVVIGQNAGEPLGNAGQFKAGWAGHSGYFLQGRQDE
jgi:hypothetical protein